MHRYVTFASKTAEESLKICFFNSGFLPSHGGVATFSYEWVRATAAHPRVSQTQVIAFGNPKPRSEKLSDGLIIRAYATRSFFAMGFLTLVHMVRNISYDVFHATNLFPVGFWVVLWSKLLFRKSVVTFHGTDACTTLGSQKTKWLKRWAITHARHAFAVSASTRAHAQAALGYEQVPIDVIYAGIPVHSLETRTATEQPKDIKKRLGIREKDFVVVCVNQLIDRKGVDYLIRAVQQTGDPTIKLIIIGDGPEKDRLKGLVSELDLWSRVSLLGRVPDVLPYYHVADICVLASYAVVEEGDYEGLGLVLLEAQRMGLPVIGTNSGGIPEAIDDGQSGFVVPEKNSKALADKILNLKHDPTLYEQMSSRAKEFVSEKFDPQKNIDQYVKILLNKGTIA